MIMVTGDFTRAAGRPSASAPGDAAETEPGLAALRRGGTSAQVTRQGRKSIAAGTGLAARPPHRSVREGLLHTAPTLGHTPGVGRPDVSCPTHSTLAAGSGSGPRAVVQDSPWSSAFPPAGPQPTCPSGPTGHRRRVTSPALSVAGWGHSSAIAHRAARGGLVPGVHRYYADVRLPCSVRVRIAATGLP